ncbi:MAG: DUF3034 family protein [Candidatus Omnitrophica bacterium]|nr:DUF3034 family protein [Candidatus Omnitrophota bacterium]
MKKVFSFLAVVVLTYYSARVAVADAPFTNLEGVGGVAFNPVAYLGGTSLTDEERAPWDGSPFGEAAKYIGKPRFGAWYVNLSDVDVNWFATGVSDTFFNRVEVSYGYNNVNQQGAKSHNKHTVGSKLLVLPENFNEWNFVPAVSVGGIYKNTDNVLAGAHNDGWDGYVVGTKLITQLPRPVLISGGVLFTDSYATGVFGYDKKTAATGFGNIDLVLTNQIITGFEYKQGPDFKTFKNADYWDAHVAWTPNKNLTLILAYVFAGNYKATHDVGLGDGVVLSAQYAF